MTAECPRCRSPVRDPGGGGPLLEPERHPLGIWAPDGRPLTAAELRAAHHAGHTIGHHKHYCDTRAQPVEAADNQLAFDL